MMLRLLDPAVDLELYRIAYQWRPRAKRHVQPDRMSFDDFVAASIVVGLWAPEFCAVFVFVEVSTAVYDCHFTADVAVSRVPLIHAATEIISLFMANGAERLTADIVDRNHPMRRFVEELGFKAVSQQIYCCNGTGHPDTLIAQTRRFVRYELCR